MAATERDAFSRKVAPRLPRHPLSWYSPIGYDKRIVSMRILIILILFIFFIFFILFIFFVSMHIIIM